MLITSDFSFLMQQVERFGINVYNITILIFNILYVLQLDHKLQKNMRRCELEGEALYFK